MRKYLFLLVILSANCLFGFAQKHFSTNKFSYMKKRHTLTQNHHSLNHVLFRDSNDLYFNYQAYHLKSFTTFLGI